MTMRSSDFEVSFNGRPFLTVRKGQLDVQGIDFEADLTRISRLMGILSEVMTAAQAEARKPLPFVESVPQQRQGNVYPLRIARQDR